MARHTTPFIVAVLLAGLLVPAAHAKTPAELLREALYAEEVEGNLDSAVAIYQQVIDDSTAPRNLVGQALYHQGSCYLKKKDEPSAKAAFQKLVTDYSDQTELVEKVRPMLEELGNADPASLMPPEVIAYVEIGSPGRQVETILNMLKGTPLENPFDAITGKKDPGQTGEQASGNDGGPADMVTKFLNPAMLAELKKIRGLGVGLTDVAEGTPPAIVVLFPGRSDALRGLLQMGLSMLGQPTTAVEGMSTLKFGSGGGVAFDDSVFIVTSPSPKGAAMLEWAVKQYKGKAHEPSLSSANASFSKIGKQARQQNAVTLWVNVGEMYGRVQKMIPAGDVPQEMKTADGLVNFKNVEDLIATFSLRETGVALEANVNFKDGSQSQFYNLIRTPNLNKDLLKTVPADAIALISLTLGGAGTAQAQVAGQKIQEATGQDLGSQIFGNIEQINLFALPMKGTAQPESEGIPAEAHSIGLTITSREPSKTLQLLMTGLRMANLVQADTQAPAASGQYELTLANNMKLFGYTDEGNKTMVLSLSPQVIGSSVTAMKQNSSVVSGGKFQDAIATMSPKTSKLVLVNVAGLLELVSRNMNFPTEEMTKKARDSAQELIKATDKTTVRLLTSEEANSFGVRLSVSDLPPMAQVVGAVTQIHQMIADAQKGWSGEAGPAEPPLGVAQAGKAPADDKDAQWAAVPAQAIEHVAYNAPESPEDLSASFKTLWDKQALYLLVDVVDDKAVNDSAEFWLDDSVEVFIDSDNSKSEVYEDKDYQYHFDWEGSKFTSALNHGESRHNAMKDVETVAVATGKGYRFMITFPWPTLGVDPRVGARIGFDVHVNDDDDSGDRDTKLMWHTANDIAWQQPSALGTIELVGLVGWWKLDEKEGRTATDSSGNGHDATVQGNPDWQPTGGKVGGAIALGGDGDFLDIEYTPEFDCSGGITLAAWIKPTTFDKPWQAIITKGDGAYRIQRNNEANTLEFACTGLNIPGGNQYGSLFGSKTIGFNEWRHIVGTYDGKKQCLYLDGVLDASQDASGAINTNDVRVQIGANTQMQDRFFNGSIDDVRIYNYGLSEAQAKQLFEGK